MNQHDIFNRKNKLRLHQTKIDPVPHRNRRRCNSTCSEFKTEFLENYLVFLELFSKFGNELLKFTWLLFQITNVIHTIILLSSGDLCQYKTDE